MSSTRKLNVLIVHANWNNRGDEAAIRAMIDSIREALPIGRMKIMVRSEKMTEFVYRDLEVLRYYPTDNVERLDSLLTVALLGRKSFTKRGREFIKEVHEADIVIHAPGGPTIGDMYGNRLTRYDHLYRVMFPRLIGKKKVFFYAPSMGPFRDRLMNVPRRMLLSRIDKIVLREGVSAKYLKDQLGLDSTVTLDSAYQNTIPEDYVNRYPEASGLLDMLRSMKVVGITVTDLGWHPELKSRPGLREKILSSISGFVDYLIQRGYTVLLIPQLFEELDDMECLEVLRAANPSKILILPPSIDSYGQQVFISNLHSMVGMRYHPCIFAAKSSVPFISVSYEHKMVGFMNLMGMDEMSVGVDDLSVDQLRTRFEDLENRHAEIVEHLREVNPELIRRSRMTTDILKELVSGR
jgi:colanic acid/amylovoran biosynthesis protein